jgi:hypothetical protein
LLFALAIGLAAGSAAQAAGPSITVYTRDLGFVRETRALEISGARDTVRLADISSRLDFSSVRLAPAGGARVTRLAYRFDVASGDGLIESAKGERVRVQSRGDRTVEGTLVSSDGSWITVRVGDGSLVTLSRTAVEEVRLLNPPASFSIKPTLEAALENAKRGRVDAELSYLTGGLSWSAEHTVVRRGENEVLWSAKVTVENTTGTDFVGARLKLVAGEPNRTMPSPSPMMRSGVMEMAAMAEKSGPDLSEENFSEYHLYTLDRPATLRDRETQALTMIEPHTVKVTPRYLYRGGDPRGVRSQLELKNTDADGLGVPLPQGRARIYEPDASGDLQFVGETRIGHTPEGEKITLDVGSAFDLVAERRELFNKRISDREREYAVEVKLRNRKKTAVTIVVEENVSGDIDVTQKSHPFTRKNSNTLEFAIPVPAGQEATLTYTVRARY